MRIFCNVNPRHFVQFLCLCPAVVSDVDTSACKYYYSYSGWDTVTLPLIGCYIRPGTWSLFMLNVLLGGYHFGVVLTVTVVQGRRVGVRSPTRARGFSFLSKCSDRLWGQFPLLLFAYWEWSGLCLVQRLSGNVPPFFWVDSWMAYEQFYLFIWLLVEFTVLMCGCYFRIAYS